MSEEEEETNYIYLLQEREFIKTKENVYKVGMTRKKNHIRFNQYPKGSILLFQMMCNNCKDMETLIISRFIPLFRRRMDIGNEYFQGDSKLMMKYISTLIEDEDSIPENRIEPVADNIKFNSDPVTIVYTNNIKTLLSKISPTSETINSKMSDYLLFKRDEKQNILIDFKYIDCNINTIDVSKFVNYASDILTNGILLSDNSGISHKKDFQIDICGGIVIVFIHYLKLSHQKVQMAIDIIDSISSNINNFKSSDGENVLSKSLLDEINNEYILFSQQIDDIISFSKDYQKKLISNVENLRMNVIGKYLATKYVSNDYVCHTCNYCNGYTTNTKKSLSAHVRACKHKYPNFLIESDDLITF